MIIFVAILGGLMNKIRGGIITAYYAQYLKRKGLPWAEAEKKAESILKTASKQSHHIVFALTFAFIYPIKLDPDWIDAVILYVAMVAGQSVGWGEYIKGMISKKSTGKPEVRLIDFLTVDYFVLRPVFANTLALSIRGFFWSFCIFVGFFAIIVRGLNDPSNLLWVMPSGLCMGILYLLAMEICQRIKGLQRGNGWQLGEIFTGFVFWGSWAYLMGV